MAKGMEEIITSRQNRQVVRLMKLTDRKNRDAERAFRFDGIKLFCEAVRNGVEIETVFVRASSSSRLTERAQAIGGCGEAFSSVPCVVLEDSLFDRVSEEKSPDGVICVAKYIDKLHKIITINNKGEKTDGFLPPREEHLILLESVRDPANIGAVIRSAAALGADRMILSADCADLYNAKTVRASMGTLFRMRIDRTDDLAGYISILRASGRRVFAAALDACAVRLGSFAPLPGDCAVIGNEGHGLTADALDACTRTVYIPMREGVESLNAAVAASLFLWELAKRN